MQIHQLALHHDVEADRLLLRIRSGEGQVFAVWLTRRLVLRLWPLLSSLAQRAGAAHVLAQAAPGALPTPEAGAMLAEQARERTLREADFSQPFHDAPPGDAAPHPLGPEPLLAHTVQLTPQDGGRLHLSILDARRRRLQLDLDANLATAVRELMAAALRQADWGIAVDASAEQAPPPRVLN